MTFLAIISILLAVVDVILFVLVLDEVTEQIRLKIENKHN